MIDDYFINGWEVQRPTTSNVGGIATDTYSKVLTIPGRMRPLSGGEIFQNERNGYKTTHRFYCGIYVIENTDRIHDTVHDLTYDIQLIRNPMEMNDHLEIDVLLEQ
jgi:hypothetical protein